MITIIREAANTTHAKQINKQETKTKQTGKREKSMTDRQGASNATHINRRTPKIDAHNG